MCIPELYTLTTCFQNTQILLHVFRNTTALSRLPTSQHAARNTASAPWKTPIVHSCINVLFIWAQTLHSTPGPLQPICSLIPSILVGTTQESWQHGQILEKPCYTVYKVMLTTNSLQAPLVTRKWAWEQRTWIGLILFDRLWTPFISPTVQM